MSFVVLALLNKNTTADFFYFADHSRNSMFNVLTFCFGLCDLGANSASYLPALLTAHVLLVNPRTS